MNDQFMRDELPAGDEETRWQAMLNKDGNFNGVFVYAVRSTGVYCKPSCAARLPRRDRVIFFTTGDEAEQAGFRACLRCRPNVTSLLNPQVELVKTACRLIEAETDRPPALQALSARLNVSAAHLQRVFKTITGVTPRQYAAAQRLARCKTSLRAGQSVISAMYDAGYGSSSRLYEQAAAQLGMTPATYRRGGKGMKIGYAITACHLGKLLVAATTRGVCAVTFGDDDEMLLRELQQEYPAADIQADEQGLPTVLPLLLAHLRGAQPHLNLPLDLQATAFQLRVWAELRQIPSGQTRSYAQVAAAIGQPNATRAVARACATNPVAIINPCHRVIRSDGSLGGYRWGLARKQKLLQQEKAEG